MTKADPLASLREASLRHLAKHGCRAYPYENGTLLGVLAGAMGARRVLELGTAIGYTAVSFAHGAPAAQIDTIERDGEHVRLARETFKAHGVSDRVTVHEGDFAAVMPRLDPGYDVAFFDGFTPTSALLSEMRRLLRTGGLLISANLTHGGTGAYIASLQDASAWRTAFLDAERETALSIKL